MSPIRHDRSAYRVSGRVDRRRSQHGVEPPLVTFAHGRGPGVADGREGVPFQVEDVHGTFPNGLASEALGDVRHFSKSLFYLDLCTGSLAIALFTTWFLVTP